MTEEQVSCPECESDITADGPEFTGGGDMFRQIGCTSCSWSATETWELTEMQEH